MRFLVMVKASEESEAGVLPSPQLLAEMGKFNDELRRSGRLELAEGLSRSAEGVRVWFDGESEPKITDGPFAETKELIAGVWVLNGDSLEEIVELMKRAPNPEEKGGIIEIRTLG